MSELPIYWCKILIFATVSFVARLFFGAETQRFSRVPGVGGHVAMEVKRTEKDDFVTRINGKDPAAWEELYVRYYKALCSYSASLMGSPATAEDLVQELLLKLWQSDRVFSVLPELTAYLYRSVYHNSLAYRRDCTNRETLLRSMHERNLREGCTPPHVDPEADMEQLAGLVGEEVIRRLYSDIHALPAEQQRIIRLSIAGFKGAEIARRLGISINTVKTQKYRGYRSLRLRLSKFFFLFTLFIALLRV